MCKEGIPCTKQVGEIWPMASGVTLIEWSPLQTINSFTAGCPYFFISSNICYCCFSLTYPWERLHGQIILHRKKSATYAKSVIDVLWGL